MGVIGELLGGMDRQNKSSNLIPLIQLKWEDVEDPLLGNYLITRLSLRGGQTSPGQKKAFLNFPLQNLSTRDNVNKQC